MSTCKPSLSHNPKKNKYTEVFYYPIIHVCVYKFYIKY